MLRRTLFDISFVFADHIQVKHVGYYGFVGRLMLYRKLSALIEWSAENSQVSVKQFKKSERTGIGQSQGLRILANFAKPKFAVGAIVIFEVFDSCVGRTQVNIQLVVDGLARIFHIHAKVRDVVIKVITTIFNYIGSFDWTSQGYPLRLLISLLAAHLV